MIWIARRPLFGQKRQLNYYFSKPLREGRFCYAKTGAKNRAKNENGSKACAWLIYKSAAKLTVRLTPHRHPLAALAGAEAKRTPERTKRTNGNQRRRRRGRSPLTRLVNRPLTPSRRALIFTVMQVAMCTSGTAR